MKLTSDEIRILKRQMLLSEIETDEKKLIVDAMKKENYRVIFWVAMALAAAPLLGYLTDIDRLEAFLR